MTTHNNHCSLAVAAVLFALCVAALPSPLAAQAKPANENADTSDSDNERLNSLWRDVLELSESQAATDGTSVAQRLAAQEKRMREMEVGFRAEIDALKTELAGATGGAADAANEDMLDEAMLEFQEDDGATGFERMLSIYGFFDIAFFKYFYEKDGALNLYVNDVSTFSINNLNLYFQSQMTPTLSALAELRFTFLPHGLERKFEAANLAEDGTLTPIPGQIYERENTWQRDSFLSENTWRGGVGLERVYFTYTPREWLNILAGRYLTPVGIWNVDHASTVVLTMRLPYMHIREMVIRSQTGLEVFGSFFPSARWSMSYAVTLSNGRGGGVLNGSILDYDENKAVGLRLHLDYESPNFTIAAGTYGYYGKVTDRKKQVVINPIEQSLATKVIDTERYWETALTGDLLVKAFGVSLQTEYIWHRVDYDLPAKLQYREKIMTAGDTMSDVYGYANYFGNGVYALLSWELPLDRLLGDFKIIPYVMYEYNSANDRLQFANATAYSAGMNLRPSPYLALKLEYVYLIPGSEKFTSILHSLAAQAAVSF